MSFSNSKKEFIPIFWNVSFNKGTLKNFVSWCFVNYGQRKTIKILEKLQLIGFGYATKAGVSISIDDLQIPPAKSLLLAESDGDIEDGFLNYQKSRLTGLERFQRIIETWHNTSESLKDEMIKNFRKIDILNPVFMMAFSGARGNVSQVRQLVSMRGLMSDPQGKILSFPIISNFREGLTLTEYVISCYGARKGVVDTALRTANAGYLTRRLVDVAQHVIVLKFDCGTKKGFYLTEMKKFNKTLYPLRQRLLGRVLAANIYKSNSVNNSLLNSDKEIIGFRNEEISATLAEKISKVTNKVFIRSPLTCQTPRLVCQLCYGWSLSEGYLVAIGEAVGVIAAQSIGEPGTQLTMRTFHTGGVFSGEMFDQLIAPYDGFVSYPNSIPGTLIRTTQGKIAFLTKIEGQLSICKTKNDDFISSTSHSFKLPAYTVLFVRNNETIIKDQLIAELAFLSPTMQKTGEIAEFVVKSEMEGQLCSGSVNVLETYTEYNDIMTKSIDWGLVWILSGKICQLPLNSAFFALPGDLVNKQSTLSQIKWNVPMRSVVDTNLLVNEVNLRQSSLSGFQSKFRLFSIGKRFERVEKYLQKKWLQKTNLHVLNSFLNSKIKLNNKNKKVCFYPFSFIEESKTKLNNNQKFSTKKLFLSEAKTKDLVLEKQNNNLLLKLRKKQRFSKFSPIETKQWYESSLTKTSIVSLKKASLTHYSSSRIEQKVFPLFDQSHQKNLNSSKNFIVSKKENINLNLPLIFLPIANICYKKIGYFFLFENKTFLSLKKKPNFGFSVHQINSLFFDFYKKSQNTGKNSFYYKNSLLNKIVQKKLKNKFFNKNSLKIISTFNQKIGKLNCQSSRDIFFMPNHLDETCLNSIDMKNKKLSNVKFPNNKNSYSLFHWFPKMYLTETGGKYVYLLTYDFFSHFGEKTYSIKSTLIARIFWVNNSVKQINSNLALDQQNNVFSSLIYSFQLKNLNIPSLEKSLDYMYIKSYKSTSFNSWFLSLSKSRTKSSFSKEKFKNYFINLKHFCFKTRKIDHKTLKLKYKLYKKTLPYFNNEVQDVKSVGLNVTRVSNTRPKFVLKDCNIGWIYKPKHLVSAISLHNKFFRPGQLIIDDVIFDNSPIYIECIPEGDLKKMVLENKSSKFFSKTDKKCLEKFKFTKKFTAVTFFNIKKLVKTGNNIFFNSDNFLLKNQKILHFSLLLSFSQVFIAYLTFYKCSMKNLNTTVDKVFCDSFVLVIKPVTEYPLYKPNFYKKILYKLQKKSEHYFFHNSWTVQNKIFSKILQQNYHSTILNKQNQSLKLLDTFPTIDLCLKVKWKGIQKDFLETILQNTLNLKLYFLMNKPKKVLKNNFKKEYKRKNCQTLNSKFFYLTFESKKSLQLVELILFSTQKTFSNIPKTDDIIVFKFFEKNKNQFFSLLEKQFYRAQKSKVYNFFPICKKTTQVFGKSSRRGFIEPLFLPAFFGNQQEMDKKTNWRDFQLITMYFLGKPFDQNLNKSSILFLEGRELFSCLQDTKSSGSSYTLNQSFLEKKNSIFLKIKLTEIYFLFSAFFCAIKQRNQAAKLFYKMDSKRKTRLNLISNSDSFSFTNTKEKNERISAQLDKNNKDNPIKTGFAQFSFLDSVKLKQNSLSCNFPFGSSFYVNQFDCVFDSFFSLFFFPRKVLGEKIFENKSQRKALKLSKISFINSEFFYRNCLNKKLPLLFLSSLLNFRQSSQELTLEKQVLNSKTLKNKIKKYCNFSDFENLIPENLLESGTFNHYSFKPKFYFNYYQKYPLEYFVKEIDHCFLFYKILSLFQTDKLSDNLIKSNKTNDKAKLLLKSKFEKNYLLSSPTKKINSFSFISTIFQQPCFEIFLTKEISFGYNQFQNFQFSKNMYNLQMKGLSAKLYFNTKLNQQEIALTRYLSPFLGEILRHDKYYWLQNTQRNRYLMLTKKDQISFSLISNFDQQHKFLSASNFLKMSQSSNPYFSKNQTYLGKFVARGDYFNFNNQRFGSSSESGIVIHFNNSKITVRKTQSFLLSPNCIFHYSHGDLVEKNKPLLSLPYKQLKTGDIVQGIPKVEQLLEARSTFKGKEEEDNLHKLLTFVFERYKTKFSLKLSVRKSFSFIQLILVNSVQRIYRSQGVSISDKHLEVIVKQMTSKVYITSRGDSSFFRGEHVDLYIVEMWNSLHPNLKKITYKPILLGISRSSLEVNSFLSAASFQHTKKVLSRSAFKTNIDFLNGLKENVIIGNLISAGTGNITVKLN
uniref:DNA-directed RNA polymerase subunit beta'' n=1 Tax=Uronema confervicola TaxID=764120 RepID=A0A6H1U7L6_9CHLO|nr:RNA polymerase beta'' subunit [Uronema confervicola]QIZ74170.1 RNA polymerase beta'' subunit [Uronema confervicola]